MNKYKTKGGTDYANIFYFYIDKELANSYFLFYLFSNFDVNLFFLKPSENVVDVLGFSMAIFLISIHFYFYFIFYVSIFVCNIFLIELPENMLNIL